MFLSSMKDRVKGKGLKVVFPEGKEFQALSAARTLKDEGVLDCILIGENKTIEDSAKTNKIDLSGIKIVEIKEDGRFDEYAKTYYELRKHKNISMEDARKKCRLANYYGALMVRHGDADGMVSGIKAETKPFLPAFEIAKLKPGFRRASSVFVLEWPERLLFFADCSVNINPDVQTLVDIAHGTIQTVKSFGIEPRVAFLSYSTHGSAAGSSVDKVKEAFRLTKAEFPDVPIDGEIQFDAALLSAVAKIKAPESPLAEDGANVFIFPDLDSGNIAYKISERLGKAQATGPILQGLNFPINDVSRGCSAEDFTNVAILTGALAHMQNNV